MRDQIGVDKVLRLLQTGKLEGEGYNPVDSEYKNAWRHIYADILS